MSALFRAIAIADRYSIRACCRSTAAQYTAGLSSKSPTIKYNATPLKIVVLAFFLASWMYAF